MSGTHVGKYVEWKDVFVIDVLELVYPSLGLKKNRPYEPVFKLNWNILARQQYHQSWYYEFHVLFPFHLFKATTAIGFERVDFRTTTLS